MVQQHISFVRQLLRGLLGITVAAGFYCLWAALFCRTGLLHPYFLFGAGATALGVFHLILSLKKQGRYRS